MDAQEKFMKEAIKQAKKAYALREVPIGCVIVYEGKIIARGYNRRNTDKNNISKKFICLYVRYQGQNTQPLCKTKPLHTWMSAVLFYSGSCSSVFGQSSIFITGGRNGYSCS